jgi:ABC-type transport system involved in multi-copper enzyme maturation permease subunit
MAGLFAVAQLTFLDLRRRRIVAASVACGAAWLLIFALAVYVMHRVPRTGPAPLLQARVQMPLLLNLAGLSGANLLAMAVAIILPLDGLSGEIASGVMQTLAVKPVRRSEIVLGKWLVFCGVLVAYVVMMIGGIVLAVRLITGFAQPHVSWAMGLMSLEACVLLGIVMAGGVRLPTVANGLMAFAFYAVASVGGWIEQIGTFLGNREAHYIGVAISLVSPTDALWRRALYLLQPPMISRMGMSPFSPASAPTAAMVWWACGFALAALLLAIRGFARRDL